MPYHRPPTALADHSRQCSPLRCVPTCTCCCHALSFLPIVPQRLSAYIGQLFVSKQLHDLVMCNAFRRCNVATCRGDFLKPARVSWFLPSWFLHGHLQSSSRRIHFSINACRTIPYSSAIIEAVRKADVQGVRNLFAEKHASIWDIDIDGNSVFWVSTPTHY